MHVLVVGGGPGGYTAALQAAHSGQSVTLVERRSVGGTCLHLGCIPTKSLLETASAWQRAVERGWVAGPAMPPSDWQGAQARKEGTVQQLAGGVQSLLRQAGVRVVRGDARFASPTDVVVVDGQETHTIKFDCAIVATGSRVAWPSIPGASERGVFTSDTLLGISQLPRRFAVVGGGVVGLEFASLFRQLGVQVEVIEFADDILPRFDRRTVRALAAQLGAQGISVRTGAAVQSIQRGASGDGLTLEVQEHEGARSTFQADAVLLAVGRVPNTDGLKLQAAGVELDRGRIVVNPQCQTSVPHIYAIGDCANPMMVAHAAMDDARVAVNHLLGHPGARKNRWLVPQCVFSSPELATVGMTEQEAEQEALDFTVSEFPMAANGRSLIAGTDGLCRVIWERGSGVILGVHMVGPHVTEVIHEAALGLELEVTVRELVEMIHVHPTVSEALHEAALAASGNPLHVPKQR